MVSFIQEQGDADGWDAFIDEAESGADDSREDFQALLESIQNDEYDAVVMSELSRLARKTSTAAKFIEECVDREIPIYLIDDMITEVSPENPMSEFFAKFLVNWYEEERKQTIRRIKSGLREARSQGKWAKAAPAGFYVEDGYLKVDIEEYLGIQQALEEVEGGESYRQAAKKAPVSRPTLMDVHKDESRRRLYLYGDAEDERMEEALEAVEV